jgi:hypothetical protein
VAVVNILLYLLLRVLLVILFRQHYGRLSNPGVCGRLLVIDLPNDLGPNKLIVRHYKLSLVEEKSVLKLKVRVTLLRLFTVGFQGLMCAVYL